MATKREMRSALKKAIAAIGSINKTAKKVGKTRQSVGKWDICPPLHVLTIEAASGVPRQALRPDLYPAE